jgi:hypothetical protein
MRSFFMIAAVLFLGCGSHLSTTDVLSGQAIQTVAESGYAAHISDDAGLDSIRYQGIYCGMGGILARAGHPSDAGVIQCPTLR